VALRKQSDRFLSGRTHVTTRLEQSLIISGRGNMLLNGQQSVKMSFGGAGNDMKEWEGRLCERERWASEGVDDQL